MPLNQTKPNLPNLKLEDYLLSLDSNISSAERDVNTRIEKTYTVIDILLTTWKYDMSNKIKREFFQAVTVSVLLYGNTIRTLTKPAN